MSLIPPLHTLNPSQILRFALQQRALGQFYDTHNVQDNEDFFSSLDRFSEIAFAFRHCRRVLDVGSGRGILAALLCLLGHEVYAVDFFDRAATSSGNTDNVCSIYTRHPIAFKVCNVEAEALPFEDGFFDALSCCQTFEHFTHAHLPPLLAMKRVLKPGGLVEIGVPNAVCFRNRSRILRGKHIT